MTFKVIDGGGSDGRERAIAEQEFRDALVEMAANLLRIVRGAGKPHDLLFQMSAVATAAVKVQEITGASPVQEIIDALGLEVEAQRIFERNSRSEISDATIDRWSEDGTFERMYGEDKIRRGALQYIASHLLHQTPQRRAGETEMHDGIRQLERAREKAQAVRLKSRGGSPDRKISVRRPKKPSK